MGQGERALRGGRAAGYSPWLLIHSRGGDHVASGDKHAIVRPAAGREDDDRTVLLLRALAHPIRFRIVQLVADPRRFKGSIDICGDCELVCPCRLRMMLDISAPDLSHHLRILRDAGLLEAGREGNFTHYRTRREVLRSVLPPIAELTQEPPSGSSWASASLTVVIEPEQMV